MASVDSRLRPSTDSWEDVPSYGQLYHELSNFMSFFVNNSRVLSFSTQYDHFTKYHRLDSIDVLLVVSLAVMWTCLRHLSTKHIFEPTGKYFKLTLSNQEKMPESAWKCSFYSAAWFLTFYSAVLNHEFFQRPSSVWDGWTLDSTVTFEIYLIYIVQTSFYLHSIYATMFVDVWRKDSLLLVFHHVVTFCLLAFSHAFRYNNIGILVLLFHDFCDIILEFTKINVYFKVRGGKVFPIHEIIANIGFVLFTVTWYLTRLYWFPLKAIFTAASVPLAMNMGLVMPLLFTMNFLLWVVLSMDTYWFMMVLSFLYRVAIGQIKEIDDTREYDVEEKIKQKLKTNVKMETNGNSEHAVNGHSKSSETNSKVQNGFCTNENADVRVRKPTTLKT